MSDISRDEIGEEEKMAEGWEPQYDTKLLPNRTEEDQDVDMVPIVVGPPAYGSPGGEAVGNQMLPATDNPNVLGTSEQAVVEALEGAEHEEELAKVREGQEAGSGAGAGTDRKASEWKSAISAASTTDELDELRAQYDDGDNEFSTVDDAFESRYEALESEGN